MDDKTSRKHGGAPFRILIVLCSCLGAAVAGCFAGRKSRSVQLPYRRDRQGYEVTQQAARFEALVQCVAAYIVEHNGHIPADPYRGLVDSGHVGSFFEFVFGEKVVRFDMKTLPPRVNPDLSRNARAVLFCLNVPEIGENWICYLDGSWERETFDGWKSPGRPSRLGKALMDWRSRFHEAGYPYWGSLTEKTEWMRKNQDSLVWDNGRMMYVPTARDMQSATGSSPANGR